MFNYIQDVLLFDPDKQDPILHKFLRELQLWKLLHGKAFKAFLNGMVLNCGFLIRIRILTLFFFVRNLISISIKSLAIARLSFRIKLLPFSINEYSLHSLSILNKVELFNCLDLDNLTQLGKFFLVSLLITCVYLFLFFSRLNDLAFVLVKVVSNVALLKVPL